MRNLKTLPIPLDDAEADELLQSFTIFEKIEFSDMSKKYLAAKLVDLRTRQVPQREVMLDIEDEAVVFIWFKNWLHTSLKHFFKRSSPDKRGCSKAVLEMDYKKDFRNFYENGQQMFDYTLADIDAYLEES